MGITIFDDDHAGGSDYAGGYDYAGHRMPCGPPPLQPADPGDVDRLARACNTLHERLMRVERQGTDRRINNDSKAGMMPSVFLGTDSEADFPGGVPTGITAPLQEVPNTKYRIVDFIMSSENPTDFQIATMNIARLNMLLSGTGIPADAFLTSVQRPPIETPLISAGTPVILGALNIAPTPRRFRGVYIGPDVSRDFDVTKPR